MAISEMGNIYNTYSTMLGIWNPVSAVTGSRSNSDSGIGKLAQTGTYFGSVFRTNMANRMKQEIYKEFQVDVGTYGDTFSCYIPETTLCRMNTDTALKEKVFAGLEKYTGEDFQASLQGEDGQAGRCTVVFDEDGETTVTLESENGKQKQSAMSAYLSYQKAMMQQAALTPYQTSLYSGSQGLYTGYPNLYTGIQSLYAGYPNLYAGYSNLYSGSQNLYSNASNLYWSYPGLLSGYTL